MDAELAAFLARHPPRVEEFVTWGADDDPLPLRVAYALTSEAPPPAFISSVRAVVLRDGAVLVCAEPDGTARIIPGGRCEAGETPEETVRREVREETGWTLGALTPIGCIHFRHLGPRPAGYGYPYPDFLQPVYAAEAVAHDPAVMIPDEWVVASGFRPLAAVRALPLAPGDRLLLDAALARR